MSRPNRRYWAGAGILLLVMGFTMFGSIDNPDELGDRVSDAVTTFLISIGSAMVGASLSQVWAERDKKKDES